MTAGPDPAFRYDANLSILYAHLPLLERPAAAARAGFTAVELWWPFSSPVPADRDVDALLTALAGAGTQLVCINLDEGDASAGERGLLSLPGRQRRFTANLEVALGIAQRAGCRIINALYGNRLSGGAGQGQDELALQNYCSVTAGAAAIGATVVVEALNSIDNPGYPVLTLADAAAVVCNVRGTGLANIGLLLDMYHVDVMTGDVAGQIREHGAKAAHVQVADSPGRGRPGTGRIDFDAALTALHAVEYTGFVGLEYHPAAGEPDWLAPNGNHHRDNPTSRTPHQEAR